MLESLQTVHKWFIAYFHIPPLPSNKIANIARTEQQFYIHA